MASADATADDDLEPCFTGTDGPIESTGDGVLLGKDSLSLGVYHYYTVECKKEDATPDGGVVERSCSSTVAFRPQSAESPIPTGMVTQQCGQIQCPAKQSPSSPLKFLLSDMKYADTEIVWSVPQLPDLTEDDVFGGFGDVAFIINPGQAQDGDILEVVATLTRTVGGTVHTGEARTKVEMNAAPYCGNAATDSEESTCFEIALEGDDRSFPNAVFSAKCSNYVDDEDIVYGFGISESGTLKVQQLGTQTSYSFEGLEEGEHTAFCCAVDIYNTPTCETKAITVDAPTGSISISQAQDAAGEVEAKMKTGDYTLVFGAVRKAATVLQYAKESEDGGRRLLQDDASVQDTILTLTEAATSQINPNDHTTFGPALDLLVDMVADMNETSARIALNGVGTGVMADASNDQVYSTEKASAVLTVVGTYVDRWGGNDTLTAEAYQNVTEVMATVGDLLCLDSSPGEDPRNVSAQAGADSNVTSAACAQETAANADGLAIYLSESVAVFLPEDFSSNCGESCPDQLGVRVTYFQDPSIHSDLIGPPLTGVGISEVAITSGVVGVEISGLDREELCVNDTCWMAVEIPVDPSSHLANKATECLRISAGSAVGGDGLGGVSFTSYDADRGVVTCNATKAGELFVAQFQAPPPPAPPNPDFPPAPMPPAPYPPLPALAPVAESPNPVNDTAAPKNTTKGEGTVLAEDTKVFLELRFPGITLAELQSDPEQERQFKDSVKTELANATGLDRKHIVVHSLREGSVIADTTVTFPAGTEQAVLDTFVEDVVDPQSDVFGASFRETYGAPEVTRMPEGPPPVDEGGGDSGPNVGLIVGLVVGGFVVLVAGLAIFFIVKCCRPADYMNMSTRRQDSPTLV
eukprot:evm.model.scf_659EXC.4 EVM.evm.TU.scf_659EXC.4   scf_659EXC:66567-72431(-)